MCPAGGHGTGAARPRDLLALRRHRATRHGDGRTRGGNDHRAPFCAGGRRTDARAAQERARGRSGPERRADAPPAAALARPPHPPLPLRPRLHRPAGARAAPPPSLSRLDTRPRRHTRGLSLDCGEHLPLERWLAVRPEAAREGSSAICSAGGSRCALCRSRCTSRRCRSTSSRDSSALRTTFGAVAASRS